MRSCNWLFFFFYPSRRIFLYGLIVGLAGLTVWDAVRWGQFHHNHSLAVQALARYDFPEARKRLDLCLQHKPTEPKLLLLATQAARRDGLLDQAEQYLDRYRDQVRESTPEGALQGVLLQIQRGAIKEHVKAMLEFIEVRHPDREQILESLAQGCVHVYRLDEASFWTKQLLDRFPANPIGRLISAQTKQTLGKREQAIEIMRQLVDDYPENSKARSYLANLLLKKYQYAEAAEQYRELHRREPDMAMHVLGLVRALVTLEQFEDVEPLLREVEQKHPKNSEVLLECGRYALRRNRPLDAESFLQRAATLSPNDHEILYELAMCMAQLKRDKESQRYLEKFQQIRDDMSALEKAFQAMVKVPGDPLPRMEAGRICLRNGQVNEGLRWLSGALEIAPGHKPTHKILAEHFQSVGDTVQANYHRKLSQ